MEPAPPICGLIAIKWCRLEGAAAAIEVEPVNTRLGLTAPEQLRAALRRCVRRGAGQLAVHAGVGCVEVPVICSSQFTQVSDALWFPSSQAS